MNKLLLFSLLTLFALMVPVSVGASLDTPRGHTTKVPKAAILAATTLGVRSVRCGDNGFTVKDQDGVHLVERGDTDDTVRRLLPSNIHAFAQKGKIQITKTEDGKYILRSMINGLGGGPVTGAVFYWGTKVLCYAGLITTAGVAAGTGAGLVAGAVGATGGAAAVTGTAMAVAGGKAAMGAGIVAATGASAGPVASVVAAGMGATAAATGSTVVATTGAIATTAATTGGIMGFIESAALGAGVLGLAIPWLP
jgi:hypothetical protein